jgi:hypothetical protein
LTEKSSSLKAASITDGVMEDYFQYLTTIGTDIPTEAEAMIGARPFGTGLRKWLSGSPLFRIDNVKAPVLINVLGAPDLTLMWSPYAALRPLKKHVA